MGSEIDKLEIVIEAEASKADRELSKLEKRMESIAAAIDKVVGKAGGISGLGDFGIGDIAKVSSKIDDLQKKTKSIGTQKVKPSIDNAAIKEVSKSVADFQERLKDVGKNIKFEGNLTQVNAEVAKTEKALDRLLEKEEKFELSGGDKQSQTYKNLQYDLAKVLNYLDQLYNKQSAINAQKIKDIANVPIQRWDAGSSTKSNVSAADDVPIVANISKTPEYNSDAMSMTFGSGTEQIKNVNDLMKQFQTDAQAAAKALNDFEESANMPEINTFEAQIKRLKTELADLGSQGFTQGDAEYDEVAAELQRITLAKKDYDAATRGAAQAERDFDNGLDTQSLSTYEAQIKRLKAELSNMNMKRLGQGDAEYDKVAQELQTVILKKKEYDAATQKAAQSSMQSSAVLKTLAGRFGQVAKAVATTGIKKAGSALGSLAQKAKSAISSLGRTKNEMNGLNGVAKKLSSGIFKLGNMLKLMITRMALQGVINGAKEGFQNLAQYSTQANANISTLMSGLTQLKNSFAAAFAPILNAVTPILSTLINYLVAATTKIGEFFAALTGQKNYTVATAVQENYAAGLASNADNADAATAANKKLQRTLLGFDQINKLDDNSDSGTSGSGGSGDAGTGTSAADMFDTATVSSAMSDLASKIKEAWKNADFTEIGEMVGNKINTALKSIPWDKIKETLNKVAKSTATFLNGFIKATDWALVGNTLAQGVNTVFGMANTFATNFDWSALGTAIGTGINGALSGIDWTLINATISNVASGIAKTLNSFISTTDWALVGTTLANAINTVINALYTFVTTFNWKKFGDAIATGINNFIKKVDLAKAGQALSTGVKGVLTTAITAIQNTDWKAVGEKVKDFIVNIDWTGIAKKVFTLLGSALGGLASFVGGLLGDGVAAAKNYFGTKIEECGGNVVAGILKGIVGAIKGVGTWIKDNIFTPIIDGFKSAFGIHSPSTVMAEQGEYIIDGLFGGLKDNITDVINWFKDLPGNIKTALGNAKDWLVQKGKDAIEGIKDGWDAVKDSKLGQTVSKIGGYVKDKVGSISSTVKAKGEDIISGIKDGYENSKESGLLSKVATLKDNVKTSIGAIKDNVISKGKDIIEGVKSGYDAVKQNGLLDTVATLKDNVKTSLGTMFDTVKTKGEDIIAGVKKGYDDNKDTLKSAVSNLPDTVKKGIGSLYNTGQSIMQTFANGFSSIGIKIPRISTSWTKHTLGALSFSVPSFSLSWYAKGGFPNAGELFMANEAGPEMVGKMGNKTTVANQMQITEGIKNAVVEGIMEVSMAMGNGTSNDNQFPVVEFNFMVDSETFYKVVKKGEDKYNERYHITATI